MISTTEAYFLGLLLAKGEIIQTEDPDRFSFRLNIKWRRPNDETIRSDNVFTPVVVHASGKEKLDKVFK